MVRQPLTRIITIAIICTAALFLILSHFRNSSSIDQDSSSIPEEVGAFAPLVPRPVQGCKVTKLSMLYGDHVFPQLEHALLSHRRQSEIWGCGNEVLQRDLGAHKLFSKQYYLMSAMLRELAKPIEERQQWLMWADADSIIINPALSPAIFLPPAHLEDVYGLVSADHNGLNTGVFYLKVHPKSLDLLTQTVAYPLMRPEDDLGWFSEQAAMAKVIDSIEASHNATSYPGIVWMPRVWFNAYQFESHFEGQTGTMLAHFAGLGDKRLTHMTKWLEVIEQTPDKWQNPLRKTFYKSAIKDFWTDFERNHTKVD